MTTDERRRLNELMVRLAGRDDDVVFVLHEEFGSWLTATMRGHLLALHAPAPDADELEGLVIDAWFELRRCAPSWRPDGGALPWNWARHRLRQVASAWVGQYADELDDALTRHPAAHVAVSAAGEHEDGDLRALLDTLAAGDTRVADFRDAFVASASARDQQIVLEVRVQELLGDPSPAITVAALNAMTPAAVRKVCSRVRSRVRTILPEVLPSAPRRPDLAA